MKPDSISISQITKETTVKRNSEDFAVCWIKDEVHAIEIDHVLYNDISNAIFFWTLNFNGKYLKKISQLLLAMFYTFLVRFWITRR